MSAVVVSHEELVTRLAAPRQDCRFCGKPFRTAKGGILVHERQCPANPDAVRVTKAHLLGQTCCRACREEFPGLVRLREHLPTCPAPPRPLPEPVLVIAAPAPVLPTCGCNRPFARDLRDPDGRCLYCSGAYAAGVGRRPTSHHAAAD